MELAVDDLVRFAVTLEVEDYFLRLPGRECTCINRTDPLGGAAPLFSHVITSFKRLEREKKAESGENPRPSAVKLQNQPYI
ncbi:hypothetical protein AKJ41_01655 [candidate division MSBL1 archaeon SCGC-AAA259O05]|uniref:Uncharacterized protein n=1 Tax=candidate division MSBL1 archaeon SCGC-AAA259O05 TaxID=1698271 RepID=A0A133V4V0_9EURY|nr:hypothetical protein AKJ41_01655 [candidate division MSBL1 archaeon SCGC-AAA259O05]